MGGRAAGDKNTAGRVRGAVRYHRVKWVFLLGLATGLLCMQSAAFAGGAEPPNSFTVEFTIDGKLNITGSILVSEEAISGSLYRLGMRGMDVNRAEDMFEESLRACFEGQMAAWRSYAGYPHHQAKLADIENYRIDGSSKGRFYHLRYRLELRSRQIMRIMDPTFSYVEEKGKVSIVLMLHFPFPDMPLGKGVSLSELAPEAMQYIVILAHPIANPRPELGDIPGFLSATAYSASFVVHPDEYITVRLIGGVGSEVFPESRDHIDVEIRGDHSGCIRAETHISKLDLRRVCASRPEVGLVDAVGIIGAQYEEIIHSFLPEDIEYECNVETAETSTELVYTISAELPDLAQANECGDLFEYAMVGDWRFIYLPVHNPFEPSCLPFFEGTSVCPSPCTFAVTMPGRINNVNEIRASGLQFQVEGGRIAFHVSPGERVFLTVGSDSAGAYVDDAGDSQVSHDFGFPSTLSFTPFAI
jgi:hypothetical protein